MNTKLLSGDEQFTCSLTSSPEKSLKDFWAWNSSDLLNNTLRGALAEYIVAMALGIEFTYAREDWSECDLVTNDGIKVEVKCSAYLQSWEQNKLSEIRFGCAPSRAFSNQRYDGVSIRHSDVYVFCVFTAKDIKTADVLNLDQWIFYILPTHVLNEKLGLQKTISLNSLLKLNPIKALFHEIKSNIDNILNQAGG